MFCLVRDNLRVEIVSVITNEFSNIEYLDNQTAMLIRITARSGVFKICKRFLQNIFIINFFL